MDPIITSDSSVTFYNAIVGDFYHSKAGAAQEAFLKYAGPTNIAELAKGGSVAILDICFGLGYNTAAAIDVALEANPRCKIRIVGLENDKAILDLIKQVRAPFKCYKIISILTDKLAYEEGTISAVVMLGDAREKIKGLYEEFDAVFLDPFSPAKQPDMWNAQLMKDIYKVMKKGAILATYSCARMVRDNLRNAGLQVSDGPQVGRRSPSTLARKL